MAGQHIAAAQLLLGNRKLTNHAWTRTGFAVECELKAVIMRRRGFNRWPSRDEHPELHTHDLQALMAHAGIDRAHVPANLRGPFKTVLTWRRAHDYSTKRMPRKVAEEMVKAAVDGVIPWLRTL